MRDVPAMPELTLESLARRVEALEIALASRGPNRARKDWRRVVGMFGDSEEVVGVAIVTIEERMRGWLAVIAKEKQAARRGCCIATGLVPRSGGPAAGGVRVPKAPEGLRLGPGADRSVRSRRDPDASC